MSDQSHQHPAGGSTPPPNDPSQQGSSATPPSNADPSQTQQPGNSQTSDTGQQPSTDSNARAGQLGKRDKHIFQIPPHPNTTFDEEYFLALLEGSISLTMEEKKRVIEAIPRLRIEQINELIAIFEEEKQKFSELEKEFADDVAKLKKERENEMVQTEVKQEEQSEAVEDEAEAEALKKKLMGGL